MSKKVIVLLSTYNGEKYVEEQLDSILGQSYQNIDILVRDDGSTDRTYEILSRYQQQGYIKLIKGKNAGFAQSFFELIDKADEADYYAFADQDDVWLPDKIAWAIELLDKADENKPVLYFSNFDFYDDGLNFIAHRKKDNPQISFRNAMMECLPLGFNILFNKCARDMTKAVHPMKSTGHDWWMYMLCAGLGQVVYDERVTVKYRRHKATTSGNEQSFISLMVWRFKYFVVNGYFRKIHEQIVEFNDFYGDRLDGQDKKEADMLSLEGFHPGNYLKKIFYGKRYRQKGIDEVIVRLVMLFGQL